MECRKVTRMRWFKIGAALCAAAVMLVTLGGCPATLTGEQDTNKAPVVRFVNVPPAGTKVSVNPTVYWVGTDVDGQIAMFRYIVRREDELGGLTPDDYITQTLPTVSENAWTYIEVTIENPGTQTQVPMSAELDDPVNAFVPQYVFVQAYDDEGMGSQIVYRIFQRNDYPPNTKITRTVEGQIFIDAPVPGGVTTGIRLTWEGSDPDLEDESFEFDWRLYGPYTDAEYQTLIDSLVDSAFVTADAQVYFQGSNDSLFLCDTTFDGVNPVVSCDTLLVDTVTKSNAFGTLSEYFQVDDPLIDSLQLNRLVETSNGWVTSVRDSIYNVYRFQPEDSTVQRHFVFWIRSRDAAGVADLTPAFLMINVILPRYERDVLLLDFYPISRSGKINSPPQDTVSNYFRTMLTNWKPDVDFVDSIDHRPRRAAGTKGGLPLKIALQYKAIILYNDGLKAALTGVPDVAGGISTGLESGVNMWTMFRGPKKSSTDEPAVQPPFPQDLQPSGIELDYFGVSGFVHSGWQFFASRVNGARIEDFTGAHSLNPAEWPDLEVDSAQLHRRIDWDFILDPLHDPGPPPWATWRPDTPYVPEINWISRATGTEPLYLYESAYGRKHPLGFYHSFEGAPVAIRYETDLFRTSWFAFTPMFIRDDQMQQVFNKMMDWIYTENPAGALVGKTRYTSARVTVNRMDARERFFKRQEAAARQAKLGGDPSYVGGAASDF